MTAAAALRASSDVAERHFECKPLPDGRVGMQLPRWRRPIRDDATDHTAHGDVTLDEGLRVSCNAYFAQLGLAVGPRALKDTADAFEIATVLGGHGRRPGPAAAVGVVRPGRGARLAVPDGAGGGDDGGARRDAGGPLGAGSPAPAAARAAPDPRAGGGRPCRPGHAARRDRRHRVVACRPRGRIAGKTGTAEVAGAPSHSWFVGFAPATGPKRIAIAVIVENGGYGARAAVPLAGDVVSAARSLGLILSVS